MKCVDFVTIVMRRQKIGSRWMGYTSLFFRERDLTPGQAEETAAAVLQNFG